MIDLIIEHATVITMNSQREILRDGAIAIGGNQVVDVGLTPALCTAYVSSRTIDATHMVALPGLINTHTHLAMSLQRGVKLHVRDGLYEVVWPIEKALTAENCYMGALLGAAEAAKAGITCVVDHYFFMNDIASAIREVGMRSVLGHTVMSHKGPHTGPEELEKGLAFVEEWKEKDGLIIPCLAPHAPDTVFPEWLLQLKEAAAGYDTIFHLHLAQSLAEVAYVKEQYGKGSVEYLHDLGILDNKVLAAHCAYISETEMDLLARTGVNVAYPPGIHALSGHPARA